MLYRDLLVTIGGEMRLAIIISGILIYVMSFCAIIMGLVHPCTGLLIWVVIYIFLCILYSRSKG